MTKNISLQCATKFTGAEKETSAGAVGDLEKDPLRSALATSKDDSSQTPRRLSMSTEWHSDARQDTFTGKYPLNATKNPQ